MRATGRPSPHRAAEFEFRLSPSFLGPQSHPSHGSRGRVSPHGGDRGESCAVRKRTRPPPAAEGRGGRQEAPCRRRATLGLSRPGPAPSARQQKVASTPATSQRPLFGGKIPSSRSVTENCLAVRGSGSPPCLMGLRSGCRRGWPLGTLGWEPPLGLLQLLEAPVRGSVVAGSGLGTQTSPGWLSCSPVGAAGGGVTSTEKGRWEAAETQHADLLSFPAVPRGPRLHSSQELTSRPLPSGAKAPREHTP